MSDTLVRTARLVSEHVRGATIRTADLPDLIRHVHAMLATVERASSVAAAPAPVERIICLDCGRSMRLLKQHIRTHHELEPAQYRAKHGLPWNSPMIAPGYSARRAEIARDIGLGQARQRHR